MSISGSPKKMAQDIVDGFSLLSPPALKKYTAADLRIIMNSLAQVKRDIRQIQVPLEEIMLLKAKNMKLSRLNQAETVVRSYCKKKRIPL